METDTDTGAGSCPDPSARERCELPRLVREQPRESSIHGIRRDRHDRSHRQPPRRLARARALGVGYRQSSRYRVLPPPPSTVDLVPLEPPERTPHALIVWHAGTGKDPHDLGEIGAQ